MLYINGRFLTQQMAGVHRYAYEICVALMKIGVRFRVVMPNQEVHSCYNTTGWDIVKWGRGNSHFWEQICLPFFFLFRTKFLLVNFTGLGPVLVQNKIMTIHDLAFFENPSWYSKSYAFFYKFMTPLCAKTSKAILTVSEFSKKEIVRYLDIDEKNIHVIYNSATVIKSSNKRTIVDIPERYLLAVSSIDPRKNFERLINVFSKLPDYNLVVVGGSNHVFKPITLRNDNTNVIFVGRVSDEELVYLYKHAYAFMYPSLYEGFGIPPIEAMSYGCPVIASDIDVLHEVCQDAALYVNPYDERDIVEKIETICSSDLIREELKIKGADNIKRFSWILSAEKLKKVIEIL